MLMGAGEAKLANWAFRGVKKATLAAKTGKTLNNLSDARKKAGVKHLFYYLVVKELKSITHFNECKEIQKDL